MKNPTNLLATTAAMTVLAGCGGLGWGTHCNQFGCVTGVIWEIGFCLPGDDQRYPACESDTAPPDDGGASEPPPTPQELISDAVIQYNTNYGISLSGNSQYGEVQLYEDDVFKTSYITAFTTFGNQQTITYPEQLADSIEADATSEASRYTLKVIPPSIDIATAAPTGTNVLLSATVEYNGVPVNYASMAYEAGPDGGLPSDSDMIGEE